MNAIIIPCFGRPGFLAVSLELIAKARGFEQHHFIFAIDLGHHTGVHEVISDFCEKHKVSYEKITPPKRYPKPGKQSFNIINAYRHAVKLGAKFIYLIEDDVFVADDFFQWHYAVQMAELGTASIASKNNNANDPIVEDLTAYYKKLGDYQSLGVCWYASTLKFVLDHIEDWYFEHPVEYCALRFPESKIGKYFAEQDGLIRRVLEANAVEVAWPHVPRCYHAGFEGYNRFGIETLPENIEEQIQMIRRICFNAETMRANIYHPEHFYDSLPVPLKNKPWRTQRLLQ